jgi:hypothetical protein
MQQTHLELGFPQFGQHVQLSGYPSTIMPSQIRHLPKSIAAFSSSSASLASSAFSGNLFIVKRNNY